MNATEVVETSQDNHWKQAASELNLSVMAKAVNTHVFIDFLFFFIFNKLAKISKHLFSHRHNGVLSVEFCEHLKTFTICNKAITKPNVEQMKMCEYFADALWCHKTQLEP